MLRCIQMGIRCALPLVLVTLGVSASFGQTDKPVHKRLALVVGINEYEHGNLVTLKAAENDARVLSQDLTTQGYEVVLLTGKEATKVAIEKRLHAVCDKARKGDLVLIALSGHGVQFDESDVACFCPVDARPVKERIETLVSMGTVYKELKASFATDKLLLIDACRNDPGVRGRSGIEANSAPVPFGVAALYGCAPGQKAIEDDKLGHGLFLHSVIVGLRGAARDAETEEVTFASLAAYVQKQTKARAAALPGAPVQTPTLEARVVAQPVLIARPSGSGKPKGTAPRKAEWAAQLRDTLKEVINQGADLYNKEDIKGCYQFYRSALITTRPALRDYPELQEAIDKALAGAEKEPVDWRKAFTARAVLDKIRHTLRPASEPAPKDR